MDAVDAGAPSHRRWFCGLEVGFERVRCRRAGHVVEFYTH
jgi:hypothetical protein